MNSWLTFINEVEDTRKQLDQAGCDIPFFRGHGDAKYQLQPSIFRREYNDRFESIIFDDFLSYSGELLPKGLSCWEMIFQMRHCGVPTRLLDWTENFSVALYFALKENKGNPCIWVLNPVEMNKKTLGDGAIQSPSLLKFSYEGAFVRKTEKSNDNPIAIFPVRQSPRLFAQKGVFTLHGSNKEPIETIYPECVKKIDIPVEAISDAETFLTLAGINEFSLYTDLDALARHLVERLTRDS